MTTSFVINKQKVELPVAVTGLVYNKQIQIAVKAHDLYNVEEGHAINAGSYEAVITLKDENNYEWVEQLKEHINIK